MPTETKSLPDAEILHSLFDYDPETGSTTWKPRPPTNRFNNRYNTMWGGKQVGCPNTSGHIQVRVEGQLRVLSRVIWKMMTGEDPKEKIDHIDGNPDNNRWVNLREASVQENTWNRKTRVDNQAGAIGVSPSFNKWISRIHIDGKQVYLGIFHTIEEASAAYNAAFAKHRDLSFQRKE